MVRMTMSWLSWPRVRRVVVAVVLVVTTIMITDGTMNHHAVVASSTSVHRAIRPVSSTNTRLHTLSSTREWMPPRLTHVPRQQPPPQRRRRRRRQQQLPPSAHRVLEFGDYAETPDACPALTTCPVICVASVADCSTTCGDEGDGLVLCPQSGACVDASTPEACPENANPNFESPCACEPLTVACPKVVELYDECFTLFQTDFYDNYTACLEAEEDAIPTLSWTGPYFVTCYVWISVVTALVYIWCLANHSSRWAECSSAAVHHTTRTLRIGMPHTKIPEEPDPRPSWTQTGYRSHPIGSLIYLLVILTMIAIQFLLFTLTIFYYMQQEAITRWTPVFYDEVQVLKCFQLVWMVGLPWSLAFCYPHSIATLFLRRCPLTQATYVAVVAPRQIVPVAEEAGVGAQLAPLIWAPFEAALRFFFTYDPYADPAFETTFCPTTVDDHTGTRSVYHRMRRYVLDSATGEYVPGYLSAGTTLGDFVAQVDGLASVEVQRRTGLVGPNVIRMAQPTILSSLVKEFSKPFYVYQNFMVWSWAPFWYYYMAIVNTFVRVLGGIVAASFQYISDTSLYQISTVEGHVTVLRDGAFSTISVKDIVPGDVVKLSPGVVYCDMVLVQADHLVVDESALTGEATPIVKTQIDPAQSHVTYIPSQHKAHTISAGTEILEVGDAGTDRGLVLKTGSFTTKGELLTEMLSYHRHKFQFDDEVKVVLAILVLEAVVLVSLVFHFLDDQWTFAWFYGVYVLGTVIPPLLPTVFVVSVGISANRLQSKRISCTYPEGLLVAGKVNAAFFDKTGTLTKQGMDFISFDSGVPGDESLDAHIRLGMAVCHTLTLSNSGEAMGTHVDKASFESTGARLKPLPGELPRILLGEKQYTIIKQFEFDNQRVTQSVIVEDEHGDTFIFVKGSPEAIRLLCLDSSVPEAFDDLVRESAKSGIYQIAIAFKAVDPEMKLLDVNRDNIECALMFGGFINFRNVLRDETIGVLQELAEGDVATAMITGDHVLTGIFIAREAGMIKPNALVLLGRKASDTSIEWVDVDSNEMVKDPSHFISGLMTKEVNLAITGEAWTMLRENEPKYAMSIAKYVRVFGRCSPTDKVTVVSTFVESGHITLMCGDGQNDCGSLKAAHVGVALSSSEASVVAPFTSLDKTIISVSEVLREGRCALASALSVYSYYIIYGQTESYLQTINAYLSITFTDWCWVFLDGIWPITLAFTLPLAKAAKRLTPRRPTSSLLREETLFGICGILVWNFFYLIIAMLALFNQDWFQCREWSSEDVSNVRTIGDNYETSVLFVVGGFQYVSAAMVLNYGYTFREAWYKNYLFVLFSVTWSLFFFTMTVFPSSFSCIWRVNCENENTVRWVTTTYAVAIQNPFNTTVMPIGFRWILVAIMAANFVTLNVWQYFCVNGFLLEKFRTPVVPPKNVVIEQ